MAFSDTFKALADPTRREILGLLKQGELSAGEIGAHFHMTGATISHHLAVLHHAGIIDGEKRGKYIYYTLNTTVMHDIIGWILDLKGDSDHEK